MKKRVLLLLAAVVLLAAFVLLIWRPFRNAKPTVPSNGGTVEQQMETNTPSAQQPSESDAQGAQSGESQNFAEEEPAGFSVTLDALRLSNFRAVSGTFPEDGSDADCDSMFAITIDNQGDLPLQYAVLELEREGTVYQFDITTLPAGARCTVYEKSGAAYPGEGEWNASIGRIAWFEEPLNLHMEEFGIRTADKIIELTNNTQTAIPGPIYVYYKTLRDGVFDGGITYRSAVPDGLAPGESYNIMTNHYSQAESRLMFITYVQ